MDATHADRVRFCALVSFLIAIEIANSDNDIFAIYTRYPCHRSHRRQCAHATVYSPKCGDGVWYSMHSSSVSVFRKVSARYIWLFQPSLLRQGTALEVSNATNIELLKPFFLCERTIHLRRRQEDRVVCIDSSVIPAYLICDHEEKRFLTEFARIFVECGLIGVSVIVGGAAIRYVIAQTRELVLV